MDVARQWKRHARGVAPWVALFFISVAVKSYLFPPSIETSQQSQIRSTGDVRPAECEHNVLHPAKKVAIVGQSFRCRCEQG